jgi:hypothetical protein
LTGFRSYKPGAEGGRPKNKKPKVLPIGFIPSLNRDHPDDIVKDFENNPIIADTEAVLMRAGEWFGKLQRVALGCKKSASWR